MLSIIVYIIPKKWGKNLTQFSLKSLHFYGEMSEGHSKWVTLDMYASLFPSIYDVSTQNASLKIYFFSWLWQYPVWWSGWARCIFRNLLKWTTSWRCSQQYTVRATFTVELNEMHMRSMFSTAAKLTVSFRRQSEFLLLLKLIEITGWSQVSGLSKNKNRNTEFLWQ